MWLERRGVLLNWPEAGHVLAELCDEERWFHWVGSWNQ
jgi:hypothetical protein